MGGFERWPWDVVESDGRRGEVMVGNFLRYMKIPFVC